MKPSELEILVIAAQQGNKKAFDLLVVTLHKPMLLFAYRLCRNESLAQELVQEAWIGMTKNLRKLNDPRAFKPWLYKMIRWKLLDHVRKPALDTTSFDDQQELSHSTACSAASTEEGVDLLESIKKLPEPDQQAIFLFYIEAFSLKEIALILDLPVGTIKSRLNRARSRLKALYV